MEQPPATSAAKVMSQTLGAGVMVALEAEKGGISTAPSVGGQHDNLCETTHN